MRKFCLRIALYVSVALAAGNVYANPKQEVLAELMFCMSFYNGMSTVVSGSSKGKMEAVSAAFATLAAELETNPTALQNALTTTADRAAGEIVGRSAEQRLTTSKKCAPWLEEGAVEKEIAARAGKK